MEMNMSCIDEKRQKLNDSMVASAKSTTVSTGFRSIDALTGGALMEGIW
jgi:hypothetical protein